MLERPPGLRGKEWQQIRDLHSYLYRLSEHLGVLLDSNALAAKEQEAEAQSPRALFQSIRSLIAEASDIQERYEAAALPKLRSLFLEQTDFALYCREAELAQKALEAADEALGERTAALEGQLALRADFVTETGSGEGFTFRLWQSGRAELWGSFTVVAVKDTPVQLPLPFALKNALAFVQGMELEALSAGAKLSFTPRETGERSIAVLLLGEKEETV